MTTVTDYELLLLNCGFVMGLLSKGDNRDQLVTDLRTGKLKPDSIVHLRDELSAVLRASGVERDA